MYEATTCRSCWSDELTEIVNLGQHYVSDFREDDSKPNKYPLIAVICEECKLVQLKYTVPSKEMYHENYGFKSGISDTIKADLKDIVSTALEFADHPKTWLDIASNDGTLLSFVPNSIHRTGVDLIAKYCEEAEAHADHIINGYFGLAPFTSYTGDGTPVYDTFDVITSISCFYDMNWPNDFVSDVSKILAKDGTWVIQQNYLLPTLELGAIDNFCFEHLEYYTLLSLEPLLGRHGLEVLDVSTSTVNGGSIRTVVGHRGQYTVGSSVQQQRDVEHEAELENTATYLEFAGRANKNIHDLRTLVTALKSEGKSIAILAASTRGATIWQAAGLTSEDIDYAVERNHEKVGKYFSPMGIRIISEGKFRENRPDYAIIGPWFFAEEIIDRERKYLSAGGYLIKPLPEVEII
jgi:NDP-4-keto-2,6-dideoxyhexose 3-C-methyltransferase